jgi:ABC-type lipoprotein export system ATPase subunit
MGTPNLILEIEGLEQRLRDRERAEEYVVYVEQSIAIHEGDFVALLGPSGCGKTTLLTVLGLLRKPTCLDRMKRFSIWTQRDGRRIEFDLLQAWRRDAHRKIERVRREHLGFALQTGELLPALTVRENIAAPLRLGGVAGRACRERVEELLDAFGFRREGSHGEAKRAASRDFGAARINKLSGGEYQRVSLARAIAHRPRLVFVDEPTAALNRELARGALRQFQDLQQQRADRGATVMITHDEQLADEFANVVIRMAPRKGEPAGEVVEVERRDEPAPLSASAARAAGEAR